VYPVREAGSLFGEVIQHDSEGCHLGVRVTALTRDMLALMGALCQQKQGDRARAMGPVANGGVAGAVIAAPAELRKLRRRA